ncbi:hypothetical protein C8P66_13242 [Humitalea rosea]|uniref:Apea-like HEPN domain-containing protein n=1 Tax=Humitalea rosea TaxID=990373 RepID=A0A2W7HY22_9PROT|nr:hypothetical protein [Humitalea rosea]PZW38958.1 hypothetical protein C8P66_13242 [Humitalea rosea]
MDTDSLKILGHLGRIGYSEDGKPRLKYRAIDPADRYVHCSCGKPDCWTEQIVPLREHMVALFRAIVVCDFEGQFGIRGQAEETWPGVIYALQMAASVEDVFADPSHVDDSEAGLWCSAAWEHDEEDREAASKYAAALIIFNFVWNAYEAATEISAGTLFSVDKVPVRARQLFKAEPGLTSDVWAFDISYRVARHICSKLPALKESVDSIEKKYCLSGASAAAELGRVFRNYIAHGADKMPIGDSRAACSRFYSVTRMLLLLIQLLILRRIQDPAQPVPLSVNQDRGSQRAGLLLRNLHRHEALWLEQGLMPAVED